MTIRDLAAELMLKRPAEDSLIVHSVGRAKSREGYYSSCTCGASFESLGHDESSRDAVAGWMHDHRAGVR